MCTSLYSVVCGCFESESWKSPPIPCSAWPHHWAPQLRASTVWWCHVKCCPLLGMIYELLSSTLPATVPSWYWFQRKLQGYFHVVPQAQPPGSQCGWGLVFSLCQFAPFTLNGSAGHTLLHLFWWLWMAVCPTWGLYYRRLLFVPPIKLPYHTCTYILTCVCNYVCVCNSWYSVVVVVAILIENLWHGVCSAAKGYDRCSRCSLTIWGHHSPVAQANWFTVSHLLHTRGMHYRGIAWTFDHLVWTPSIY